MNFRVSLQTATQPKKMGAFKPQGLRGAPGSDPMYHLSNAFLLAIRQFYHYVD